MDTKETILAASVKAFAKNGFDQVSVDEIASISGIAKGTIYYHFASKDEIVTELIDREMALFNQRISQKTTEIDDPAERLKKVIELQLDFYFQHRDFCRFLFSELWKLEKRWKKSIALLQREYIQLVQGIIEQGKKDGVFKPEIDTTITSVTLFSALAVASLELTAFYPDVPLKTAQKKLSDLFMSGIIK